MTRRRLVQLIVLAALVLAPFGRIGVAQAKAMPDHASMMAAHCAGQPMPGQNEGRRIAVDCMIACAAMAPVAAPFVFPDRAAKTVPRAIPLPRLCGIRPEAEPPPPRLA